MTSKHMEHCCTIGIKHDGTPSGHIKKVAGVDAYIAEPKGDVHKDIAILYVPDVIGVWQNSKLIADQYAANGYYTLLLDVFNGDPVPLNRPPNYDMMAWRQHGSDGKTPHTPEAVDPLIAGAIDYLRDEVGIKKIGGVGVCFGAKPVAVFMAKGKGIDVGYFAHPSFVSDEELAGIAGPLAISAAEVDQIFTVELRHKSEEILKKSGIPWQIYLYSGVQHGFATRGDPSKKLEWFAKQQAFLQSVTWFDTHLLD